MTRQHVPPISVLLACSHELNPASSVVSEGMQVRASPDIGKEPCIHSRVGAVDRSQGIRQASHVLTALRLDDYEHGTGRSWCVPDVRRL